MAVDADTAESRLGHRFSNLAVLDEALTHSSAASPARPHNQRLEFLGDRVLGLVIADALAARYPNAAEGELAPRFNELVRKETCAAIAREIGVDGWLRLGKSENRGGVRRKTAILGDAMEAVIAAVYLDGGLPAAQKMILRHWKARIETQGDEAPRDPKTWLQEWAQSRAMRPPRYEVKGRDGPDHAPLFTVEATLENGAAASAQGTSKRGAEQEAASRLLHLIGEIDD
ncbi:ribonuclease III [Pikeienuella sp. HZG-20]|uniref:ribonuclease III n=1 Tax=Paludibacillus litoralis TaxID=3133267 RepID=UPI0030EED76B